MFLLTVYNLNTSSVWMLSCQKKLLWRMIYVISAKAPSELHASVSFLLTSYSLIRDNTSDYILNILSENLHIRYSFFSTTQM